MKKIVYVFVSFLLLSCVNKAKNLADHFDYGMVEKGVYKNRFFEFTIPVHEDWVIQNKEQINRIVTEGTKLIAGDDKNMEAVLKASEVNTAYLLSVFKYEIGAPVDYNPSFMIIAENISDTPGIKRGSDYLFQLKKILEQAQIAYTFPKEVYRKQISETSFDVLEAQINLMGKTVTQDYISCVKNGFSLSFAATYSNEEEKVQLYEMIDRLKI